MHLLLYDTRTQQLAAKRISGDLEAMHQQEDYDRDEMYDVTRNKYFVRL